MHAAPGGRRGRRVRARRRVGAEVAGVHSGGRAGVEVARERALLPVSVGVAGGGRWVSGSGRGWWRGSWWALGLQAYAAAAKR